MVRKGYKPEISRSVRATADTHDTLDSLEAHASRNGDSGRPLLVRAQRPLELEPFPRFNPCGERVRLT